MSLRRVPGQGWLALLGGGEFSFGETVEADRAWMAKAGPGPIGFLPTASGSTEYGEYLAAYLAEGFQRELEVVPVYRRRDARRARNLERISRCAAVYVGGGVTDHLLEALVEEPAGAALAARLADGGVVVGIAAAAQVFGIAARSLLTRALVPGLSWLLGGVVEPNFDPGHDRRLRELLAFPGASWGVGLPAGSALLLGPAGEREVHGTVFLVRGEDGDLEMLEE
jgi:hypothetical protein